MAAYRFGNNSSSCNEIDAPLNKPLKPYPEPDIRELAPDDVFSILLDPSRTFADFGESEFTPIETTVTEAIRYYQQHGTLGEYTHLRLEEDNK